MLPRATPSGPLDFNTLSAQAYDVLEVSDGYFSKWLKSDYLRLNNTYFATNPPFNKLEEGKVSRYPPAIKAIFEDNIREIKEAQGKVDKSDLLGIMNVPNGLWKESERVLEQLHAKHREFLTKIFWALNNLPKSS